MASMVSLATLGSAKQVLRVPLRGCPHQQPLLRQVVQQERQEHLVQMRVLHQASPPSGAHSLTSIILTTGVVSRHFFGKFKFHTYLPL